jgi:hypothetical protein
VHHFDPESKKKTEHAFKAAWLTPFEEIQVGAISREDGGFISWVSQGIIMIDYL